MMNLRTSSLLGLGLAVCAAAPRAQVTVSAINFAPLTLAAGIEDMALADVNADGFTDIVCAYRSGIGASAAAIVTVIYNSTVLPALGPGVFVTG